MGEKKHQCPRCDAFLHAAEYEEWRCPFCAEEEETLRDHYKAGVDANLNSILQRMSDACFEGGYAKGKLESLILQIRLIIKYPPEDWVAEVEEVLDRFEEKE